MDMTYVSTWSGWVYVAFVTDAYARRILGWRCGTSMTTQLVLDALEQAIWTRARAGVTDLSGLVCHNDGGSGQDTQSAPKHGYHLPRACGDMGVSYALCKCRGLRMGRRNAARGRTRNARHCEGARQARRRPACPASPGG